jgi:ribonuclease Z
MKTEIFSKGLYSTYLYVKSINSCFDCGEGMTTQLGPRCFGIRKLFISHGHHDHISGISSLIGARCVARGDNNAPLDIYYPENCREVEELKTYIAKTKTPTFPLNWITINPDQIIPTESEKRVVRAFKVAHTDNSLGFSILEKRKKVKTEYQKLSPQEFQRLRTQGVEISKEYLANIWSYSGDASNVNPKDIVNAEWLFCDSTFLNPEDRKEKTHYSLPEVLNLAKEAKVKRLVGIHISPRYTNKECKDFEKRAKEVFPNCLLLPFHKPLVLDSNISIEQNKPPGQKLIVL